MARRKRDKNDREGLIGGDFWAGYSDLLAGALLVLLAVSVIAQVDAERAKASLQDPTDRLRAWNEALKSLCEDEELKNLGIAVNCDTGEIQLPSKIFFEYDRAELKEDGKAKLRKAIPKVLARLRSDRHLWDHLDLIEVRGHADPRALLTDKYRRNMRVSQRRSETVLGFLTSDEEIPGLDREDLTELAVASGAAHKRAPECTDSETKAECHERARRVGIHFSFQDDEFRRELYDLLRTLLNQESEDA